MDSLLTASVGGTIQMAYPAAYEAALQNFNSIPDRLPRLTPRGAKLLAILVTARMRLVTEALPASELQSFCRPHHVLWTVR